MRPLQQRLVCHSRMVLHSVGENRSHAITVERKREKHNSLDVQMTKLSSQLLRAFVKSHSKSVMISNIAVTPISFPITMASSVTPAVWGLSVSNYKLGLIPCPWYNLSLRERSKCMTQTFVAPRRTGS